MPLTECLCLLSEVPCHTLSLVYKFILAHTHSTLPTYKKYGQGSPVWDPPEDWHITFIFTHKSSVSSYAQEKNFKLLVVLWPGFNYRIFATSLDICWRCCRVRSTFLHIWWNCDLICLFWTTIFQVYSDIRDESLTPSPTIDLLSILPGSVKSQKSSLLRFFLSAARQFIYRF